MAVKTRKSTMIYFALRSLDALFGLPSKRPNGVSTRWLERRDGDVTAL
jgi:hypothetical protein